MRVLCVMLLVVLRALPAFAVKAFPTAEGFGAADTVGGRGGVVMQVTNLGDSGPGSFRACAEGTGPRTCVFTVGGIINLASAININDANSFLTIAGQTAPGEGITLTPWPVNIAYGAHHVLIRYLRHRQGFASQPPNENNDCGGFTLYGPDNPGGGTFHVHHVILDHVSTGYTCDDSMQMSGHVTDATIQWSIVADPYECKNSGPPSFVCQLDPYGATKGFIFGTNSPFAASQAAGTVHHTMFLNTGTRNPGGGPQAIMDWRYNLVYHWFACSGGMRIGGTDENIPGSLASNHNFVGNRYIAGPETNTSGCWLGELRTESHAKVYVHDNVTPFCGMDSCAADEWLLGWGNGTTQGYPAESAVFQVFTPFAAPPITATPRTLMESTLATNAGARIPFRDALDSRVISEMQTRTGNIGRLGAPFPSIASCDGVSTTPPCTAYPPDTDGDGIPDSWENTHGLNPANGSDGAAIDAPTGYSNLELYLNELAGDSAPLAPPTDNANTIYVAATGGAPTTDCFAAENQATPIRTITGGLVCMTVPGKHLSVKAGTYVENIVTNTHPIVGGNGPSFSTATVLEAFGSDVVTLRAPSTDIPVIQLNNGTSDKYIIVRGFIIDGNTLSGTTGIQVEGSQHIRLENIEIKNTGYEGMYGNNATDIQIVDSSMHNLGYAGISFDGTNGNWLVERTTIRSNADTGIVQNTGTVSGLLVKESTIRDNGGSGIIIGTSTGVALVNNLIVDNSVAGVRVKTGSSGTTVYNNTLYSNTGNGFQCDSGATDVLTTNNILFGNGTNFLNNCSATNVTNSTADPVFVNPPTDWHYADGSPAINAGTTLLSVPIDYYGTSRPQGSSYDIGHAERDQITIPGTNVTVFKQKTQETGMFFGGKQ